MRPSRRRHPLRLMVRQAAIQRYRRPSPQHRPIEQRYPHQRTPTDSLVHAAISLALRTPVAVIAPAWVVRSQVTCLRHQEVHDKPPIAWAPHGVQERGC